MQNRSVNVQTGEVTLIDLTAEEEAAVQAAIDADAAGADDRTAAVERKWRNSELVASDYTQLSDSPLTAQSIADWADYRTALRNMPEQTGFPNTHTRPTAPS